jgi:predicted RNA polymerase sigma factor
MADSRIRVGGLTSTVTFAKTEQEVATILTWFLEGWVGPMPPEHTTPTQQNQWRLEQAHRRMLDYVRREAAQNRARHLRAEIGDIDAQAQQETEL